MPTKENNHRGFTVSKEAYFMIMHWDVFFETFKINLVKLYKSFQYIGYLS
jgi:hypothetical protein